MKLFKNITTDKILSTFFHLISVGLNVFAFFNLLTLKSLLPQIVIASFGASLVVLQIDSLRKWKTTRGSSVFVAYIICTLFSLLSTCYVVTTFSATQAETRNSTIDNIAEEIITEEKAAKRYEASSKRLEDSISELKVTKDSLLADKEFYGDNFFTLKANLATKIDENDTKIQKALDEISENNNEITKSEARVRTLKEQRAPLSAEQTSDVFTQLSKVFNISILTLTGIVFFLLAAILELGIFLLTPALTDNKKEEEHLIKDLLSKVETLELQLKATQKTKPTSKKVSIDNYINAMFSSNSKKLVKKDDVARILRWDQNLCDDFYYKLTHKHGDKNLPFIQTAQGRGTYSEYTKEEIKKQFKLYRR